MNRYGHAEFPNIPHVKALAKLYSPGFSSSGAGEGEIWTVPVHPGLIDSNLESHAEHIVSWMKKALDVDPAVGGRFDADKGSWTSLFCAASLQMRPEQSGTYLHRIAEAGYQSCNAKDISLSRKLQEWIREQMKKERWVE
ncbi:hypothetical protein F5B20DRAFT_576478 [Whalleya microplaca]|nr:hypothetical protein F5B20DRAFT_576478 [Whalleya microplaca]